jgi:hypothetical protein
MVVGLLQQGVYCQELDSQAKLDIVLALKEPELVLLCLLRQEVYWQVLLCLLLQGVYWQVLLCLEL